MYCADEGMAGIRRHEDEEPFTRCLEGAAHHSAGIQRDVAACPACFRCSDTMAPVPDVMPPRRPNPLASRLQRLTTPNPAPEPRSQNPEPRTQNPEPRTPNPEPRTTPAPAT